MQLKSKNNQSKMGRKFKQPFLQRCQMDGQKVHKKVFDTVNYLRNANQNYNKVSPHTG